MVNPRITEWTPEQVADWLSGLGPTVRSYVPQLLARGVDGNKLLTLRCDDLDYLGVTRIGHQELILEAVEHLRNFQFEVERECVQQLALRVSVCVSALRSLSPTARRLDTQALADVAAALRALKPLVCWLDRWSLFGGSGLSERRAVLLRLALEAATSAQRDRFAEQPARAVQAAAADIAAAADYILQDVSDHMILIPASLDTVTLHCGSGPGGAGGAGGAGARTLGFDVVPSFCGHRQLADIRFGSPAHRHGNIHEGDEIVQVGDRVVIGWSGEEVLQLCASEAGGGRAGELQLRLRRRGARAGAGGQRAGGQGGRGAGPGGGMLYAPYTLSARRNRFPPPWEYNDLRAFKREIGLLSHKAEPESQKEVVASDEGGVVTQGEGGAGGQGAGPGGGEGGGAGGDACSSDESEPLSPPGSPSHATVSIRLYGPRPCASGAGEVPGGEGGAVPGRGGAGGEGGVRRRYTVSGGSPLASRPHAHHNLQQFWQELKSQKWMNHSGEAEPSTCESDPPYRRDKALSCSTGLQLDPRPQTCLGVALHRPLLNNLLTLNANKLTEEPDSPCKNRGKLDKSHSTPAYDCQPDQPGAVLTQTIPESPTTPTDSPTVLVHSAEKADQILDFKKSSSQIGVAILQQKSKRSLNGEENDSFTFDDKEDKDKLLETINIAMIEHQNKESKTSVRYPAYKHAPSDNGHNTRTFSVSEHVKTIQNEIVQAINEQRVVTNSRHCKPLNVSDVAPDPPPRPVCTQKPIIKEPPSKEIKVREYPVLKAVKPIDLPEQHSPLKPLKHGEPLQISLPLKHITKHDIQMIASERRELPPLNSETNLNMSQNDVSRAGKDKDKEHLSTSSQRVECSVMTSQRSAALSPTASVVRGIFPSSKSRSLKKKNSILAKGRCVPCRAWAAYCTAAGGVWQRVRRGGAGGGAGGGAAGGARWVPRHLLLVDTTLLAYRTPDCNRADCLIHLAGFTVSAAPEVKSRAHVFKVYHTGTAFYFSTGAAELAAAWTRHIHRATLASDYPPQNDHSKQFSETDYSDGESDTDSPEKRSERDKDRVADKEKDKDKSLEKDKSKFGSLKKIPSEHAASLDRKYLRFFSRAKHKDDSKNKNKNVVTPVPTEHYRSYRRVPPSELAPSSPPGAPAPLAPLATNKKKIPTPINYIHASNPNLLDFEKSDFVTKLSQVPLSKHKVHKPENFIGFVTLEEFMLKKQEEERQQVYSNRVLMGIERDKKETTSSKKAAKELQKQLDKIVPDVIYGELPTYSDDQLPVPVVEQIQSRSLPKTPEKTEHRDTPDKSKLDMKPVSIKGKDGYEKIVYTSDKSPRRDLLAEPPKILPRKLARQSPDVARKCSLTSAKDLGYELIYGDEPKRRDSDSTTTRKMSNKDLGYETVFGDETLSKKPAPEVPPKIMPKSAQVLNRQSSLTSSRGSGVDSSPVFLQGESPEKFWLNSLRRNDKVHGSQGSQSSLNTPKPLKSARQYTPIVLPLTHSTLVAAPEKDDRPQQLPSTSPSSPQHPPSGMSRLRALFGGGGAGRRGGAQGGAGGTAAGGHQEHQPEPVPDAWAVRLQRPDAAPHYPHLQCPPTFEPETYSLVARITHREDKL